MKDSRKSKIQHFQSGAWNVEVMPDDGGRIRRLAYHRHDLLTAPPKRFRSPRYYDDQYEKRPVYGYDDCFPTVDPCPWPLGKFDLPDHGELCWLKAHTCACGNSLKCVYICKLLPFVFEREMIFNGNRLGWIFTVINTGNKTLPYLHIMHPLMPVSKVERIDLPDFAGIVEEPSGKTIHPSSPESPVDCHRDAWLRRVPQRLDPPVADCPACRGALHLKTAALAEKFLVSSTVGRAYMFLLRGVKKGFFRMYFRGGVNLSVSYDRKIFPTLAIWWNRRGSPAEKGLARDECAIEPLPAAWSSLAAAYKSRQCLFIRPRQAFTWRIEWQVNT